MEPTMTVKDVFIKIGWESVHHLFLHDYELYQDFFNLIITLSPEKDPDNKLVLGTEVTSYSPYLIKEGAIDAGGSSVKVKATKPVFISLCDWEKWLSLEISDAIKESDYDKMVATLLVDFSKWGFTLEEREDHKLSDQRRVENYMANNVEDIEVTDVNSN